MKWVSFLGDFEARAQWFLRSLKSSQSPKWVWQLQVWKKWHSGSSAMVDKSLLGVICWPPKKTWDLWIGDVEERTQWLLCYGWQKFTLLGVCNGKCYLCQRAVGQNLIGSFGRLQDTKPLQSSYEPLTASPLHILLLAHYLGTSKREMSFLTWGLWRKGTVVPVVPWILLKSEVGLATRTWTKEIAHYVQQKWQILFTQTESLKSRDRGNYSPLLNKSTS